MRLLLPLVMILALAAAAVVSVRHAVADETIAAVNGILYDADKTRAATGATLDYASWKSIEAEATLAVSLAPQNGHYWNALARVYYQPRSVSGAAIGPDYSAAYRASRASVVAQPTSGYAWASLAYASDHLFAQNLLPGGKAALEQAISRAAVLGARETPVLGTAIDLGLANWPVLETSTQQDVLRAVRHLAQRHKEDVLAIAYRRGAVPTVCTEPAMTSHRICKELTNHLEAKDLAS
ncbi:MAG: hypothetical protein H7232_01210 [Aeromicrobium sp.]|nr:hypothetical protein [Burkholderiales bacterium]